MGRWADYGVFRVKYDGNHAVIAELEVAQDLGDKFGAATRVSRQTVVASIEQGTTFVTAPERDGKQMRGEDVRVVHVGPRKFLRTDRNRIEGDNLGALPRYL